MKLVFVVALAAVMCPIAASAADSTIDCASQTIALGGGGDVTVTQKTGDKAVSHWSVQDEKDTSDGHVVFMDGNVGRYTITMTIKGKTVTMSHQNGGKEFFHDICMVEG